MSHSENSQDSINKIQQFWVENHRKIANKVMNDGAKNDKIGKLTKLLSEMKFNYLRRSRSIIGLFGNTYQNIYRLEIWCTANLKSIQSQFDRCPYLHLYFQTKNFQKNKQMIIFINTEASNIYNVLMNECQLFDSIILLIIEYVSHEDSYCELQKMDKEKQYKFESESGLVMDLEQHSGVSDFDSMEMIMKSVETVFDHYAK